MFADIMPQENRSWDHKFPWDDFPDSHLGACANVRCDIRRSAPTDVIHTATIVGLLYRI